MRWTYDANADAFYLYLTGESVVSQAELDTGMIADLDENGAVVGVELIGGMRALELDGLEALGVPQIALQTLAALAAQQFPALAVRPVLTDAALPPSEAGVSVEPATPTLLPALLNDSLIDDALARDRQQG